MSDKEFRSLIEQLKNGDNRSLKFIFEDHSEFCIQNLMRNSSCTLQEAEDIFMDAVINFRDKAIAGKISYLTNIRNYMYTTCLNMQKALFTAKKRTYDKKDEVLMYFQHTDIVEDEEELRAYEANLTDLTMTAFKMLDERCQQVLSSFYIKRKKMSEIASKIGVANANVAKIIKSRCYKKWINNIKMIQEKQGGKGIHLS